MRKCWFTSGLLVTAALVSTGLGQINLSSLNSRSVRTSNWTGTRMDTVSIDAKVGNGLATTMLTFSVEPQGTYNCRSERQLKPDTMWYTNYIYNYEKRTQDSIGRLFYLSWYKNVCDEKPSALDSLEISSWFRLPTDFVAKNMWLWINGEPVLAYIQDKMLAQTQYNQIVGRRMDPALLTYDGNGSFQFRMFPLSSYQARKVAIEFQHTFTDDSLNLISACIPVTFDTAQTYWYWWDGKGQEKHGIGHVKVTLSATDNKKYSYNMPGLGSGTFDKNTQLLLNADNVVKLGVGTITATDPSGSKTYAWSGNNAKTSTTEMGFSTIVSESTVTLAPEPNTRIIVLDIHQKMWDWKAYYKTKYTTQGNTWNDAYYTGDYYKPFDLWQRAQKLAVVAIKNYVDSGKKFNVIINGKSVFNDPVAGTLENMLISFTAIAVASPDAGASTVAALKKAVGQAGEDVVVFISDFMSPPDGWGSYRYNAINIYDRQDTMASGKFYLAQLDSLKKIMEPFKGNLFTISDDYYYYGSSLSNLAYESGGYQLASLRNRYYYAQYYTLNSKTVPENFLPSLPRLYLDRGGITNLKVTFADGANDGLMYTIDGYSYWWWGWGDGIRGLNLVDDAAIAKKSGLAKMTLPGYYGTNTVMLRVAFPTAETQFERQLVVTGKIGGLNFTKQITTVRDAFSGDAATSVQWAFRKAEHLAHTPWNNNWKWDNWKLLQDSIKAVGYAYHISTANTAFLALEPGMKLAVDSTMSQAQGSANSSEVKLSAGADMLGGDRSYSSESGPSLDDLSLEDLIAGKMPVINKIGTAKTIAEFMVSAVKSRISIAIPTVARDKDITLSIYDLKGRLVISKRVLAHESKSGSFVWNLASERSKISRGFYTMRISAGSSGVMFKLPLY
jgi:hypothetical protein